MANFGINLSKIIFNKPDEPEKPVKKGSIVTTQVPNAVIQTTTVGGIGDALVVTQPEQSTTDKPQEEDPSDNYEPKFVNIEDIDKIVSSIISGSVGPEQELYKDLMYTISEGHYTKEINESIKKYNIAIKESQYDDETTDGMRESWSANLERLIADKLKKEQSSALDIQLINDIAQNGPGDPIINEKGEIISYTGDNWKSLQGGITNNENKLKDILKTMVDEQSKWAKGSPKWDNLQKAIDCLKPSTTKRTKQQLVVGYNQEQTSAVQKTKQEKTTRIIEALDDFYEKNADKFNEYGNTKDEELLEEITEFKDMISELPKSEQIKFCIKLREDKGKKWQLIIEKLFPSDVLEAAKKETLKHNKKARPKLHPSCYDGSGAQFADGLYTSSGNPIKG